MNLQPLASDQKPTTTSTAAPKARAKPEGQKAAATHELSPTAETLRGYYQFAFFKAEKTESILSPRVPSKRPQEKTARTKLPTSEEAEKNLYFNIGVNFR